MSRTLSMYEQAMGERFARLDPAVQAFHRLAGRHALHGWVRTQAPQSLAARLLALCLGTPLRASEGAIRFELQAGPLREVWTRFFPAQTMRSSLHLQGGQIIESLGAARLGFRLEADGGRLVMRLQQLRFLGMACPTWLQPRIVAEERGEGDRLHFRIEAAVPWVGVVASYSGHLQLPTVPQDTSVPREGES